MAEDVDPGSSKKPPGLAELIARIFEQLAVSAWLPAAMLIGVGSLLVQLRADSNLDVGTAVATLANPQSWGIVIILLFGLVLTTMVTQAFSFGIIRFLEGYWTSTRLLAWLMRLGVRYHVRRASRLRTRTIKLEQALHQSAEPNLARESAVNLKVWMEQLYVAKPDREVTDRAVIRAANAIDWRKKGAPDLAALFERAHDLQADYPREPTRILPTRLGNVLRAAEDELGLKGHALERFVMENYARIPTRLMTQHDQFRDRLDMYALLVLVFAFLSMASIPLLWPLPRQSWAWVLWAVPTGVPAPTAPVAALAVLSWMSYRAAIASARGYGSTLLAIKQAIGTGTTGATVQP